MAKVDAGHSSFIGTVCPGHSFRERT